MDSTGFEASNIPNKKIVFADNSLGTTLVGDTWKDVSFKPSNPTKANIFKNTKEQRQVLQSLFGTNVYYFHILIFLLEVPFIDSYALIL